MVTPATALPLEGEALRQHVFALLEQVPDPEIPVVSIRELGILRDVTLDGETVEVVITPTYSGCPAMQAIEEDVLAALRAAGIAQARVRTVLSPPWSTDWITPEAREKLRSYGIAPPAPRSAEENRSGGVKVEFFRPQQIDFGRQSAPPACPQCGSRHTELLSQFGSTSCKALYRCLDCREPFDYFKPY
jgi:ring-1,2-phenylacetyl-CoA epoxidase subunit PaaD